MELTKTQSKLLNLKAPKEKEVKPTETSFFETDDAIFEEVVGSNRVLSVHSEQPLSPSFVKFNKKTEGYELIEEFEIDDITYKPVSGALVKDETVLLPSGVEEYGTTQELIKEIEEYIFDYVELPEFYHKLLPYVVLFYWLSDKYPFLPYVHFVGLTGTGKSVALEVLGFISYKGIRCSGSLSTASIFRLADQFRGTLLLNEFELGSKNSESYSEKIQILKSGTEDFPVFRIGEENNKKTIESFKIKSPRIFASQNGIPDAALASRTIEISMSNKTRELPLYRLSKFKERASLLRNKLLLWRLRNMGKVDLQKIEFGSPELKGFDGRVQQIMTPIFVLADEETRVAIITFMQEKEEDSKRERLEELDGVVFMTILSFWEESELKRDIGVSEVTNAVNEKREEQGYKYQSTEKKIGIIIRKVLGIKTERHNEGYRLALTPKKIEELKKHFGIVSPVQRDSSQSTPSTRFEAKEQKTVEKVTPKVSLEEFINLIASKTVEAKWKLFNKISAEIDNTVDESRLKELQEKVDYLVSDLGNQTFSKDSLK